MSHIWFVWFFSLGYNTCILVPFRKCDHHAAVLWSPRGEGLCGSCGGEKNDKKKKSISFYGIDNHCVSVLQSTFESILKLLLKNMTDFLVSRHFFTYIILDLQFVHII